MNLIVNNKLKPFLIFIFSYLYLNLYFLIINNNFKEDFYNNRTNISYIWPHTINFKNILYFKTAAFINNTINNPGQTIIIIGSIALSIYIYIFLKHKNSLYLFINFLIIPITPVFFISINRFAISSAIIIFSIDYFYNEKPKKFTRKIIFFLFQLFGIIIHITSFLLLFLNIKDLEKVKKFLNPNFYILKAHNSNREIIKIIFFLFLIFIIFLYFMIFNYISLNNFDFSKLNILTNCLIYECQLKYSIFLLPFSFCLIIFYSKEELKNKYSLLTNIFLISFLNFISPLFWRFLIPIFGILPRFASKSNIIPNLILMFYTIYLLPKYIMI